ncbi:MAG: hypothetical protein ACJA06_000042 [Halocynthiibacter sp.]|jgi:hypothetical protein
MRISFSPLKKAKPFTEPLLNRPAVGFGDEISANILYEGHQQEARKALGSIMGRNWLLRAEQDS